MLLTSKISDAIVAHMILTKIDVAECKDIRIYNLIIFYINFVNIKETKLKNILWVMR